MYSERVRNLTWRRSRVALRACERNHVRNRAPRVFSLILNRVP